MPNQKPAFHLLQIRLKIPTNHEHSSYIQTGIIINDEAYVIDQLSFITVLYAYQIHNTFMVLSPLICVIGIYVF